MHQRKSEDSRILALEVARKNFKESTESATTNEKSFEAQTYRRRLCKKIVAWRIFKNIVFLVSLTCLIIQAVDFFAIYRKYPTNIALESALINNFKVPAITLCFRNILSAGKFCSEHPNLCAKPNNLAEFCQKHPIFCTDDTTKLVIPKDGYYTTYTEEVQEIAKQSLLNESEEALRPFNGANLDMEITITFVKEKLSFLKCYSYNLHLYHSNEKPATKKLDFTVRRVVLMATFNLNLLQLELFNPRGEPQVYFYVHSPSVPINPVWEGHALRAGFDYYVEVQLEKEEHLLPPPYQTNCKDYESQDGNGFQIPNSYEMCLEICREEFYKECTGCGGELTMRSTANKSCDPDDEKSILLEMENECANSPGRMDEIRVKHQNCIGNCRPDCTKLKYKYNVVESSTLPYWVETIPDRETYVPVYVRNAEVTVLRHTPLYGKWELFSSIGGLLGLWLGISVWTFTDIIENFSRRIIHWKKILRLKSGEKSTNRKGVV